MTKPESVRQKISHFTILSRLVIGHFLLYKPITVTIKKSSVLLIITTCILVKVIPLRQHFLIYFTVTANVKLRFQARFGLANRKIILTVQKLRYKNVVWQDGKQAFLIKNISVMQPLSYRQIISEALVQEARLKHLKSFGGKVHLVLK